jgi:hypothetical protein
VLYRDGVIYEGLLAAQIIFYSAAAMGWLFESREIKIKVFFMPFYFCLMNYAVIRGIGRYLARRQSVVWEKAERKIVPNFEL